MYAAAGANDGAPPTINYTVPGTTYTAGCWVKATKIITINVQLHELPHDWTSVSPAAVTSLKLPTTTTWYQLQVSYTTIGTGNMLPFSVYSTNTVSGGATFEVDDCSLVKGPAPYETEQGSLAKPPGGLASANPPARVTVRCSRFFTAATGISFTWPIGQPVQPGNENWPR
jgi:hypothetical protein